MTRTPVFWTLSEALSWLAFGNPMDRKSLNAERAGACFGVQHEQALKRLEVAIDVLATLGHASQVEMHGRWTEPQNPNCIGAYMVIPAIKLAEFRAFDITNDGIRRTRGVLWLRTDISNGIRIAAEGFFSDVLVKVSDLQKHHRQPLSQKPKLPPLPQATLKRWFNGLPEQTENVPAGTLWAMAKTAHPNHSVTRRMMQGLRIALPPGRPKKSPQI